MTEADVIVNSAYRFNSYRGALHSGPVYDFHRILLHEFGHVLGLSHSTDYPEKTKIMEPVVSDWDHLGADDIAGVRNLYGADFYYPGVPLTLRVGYLFIWDIYPNNNPTYFSAIGLPPGLSVESDTGRMIGTPTRAGVYNVVVTAHGPLVNIYGGYQLTVLGLEEIPGLLKILPMGVSSLVADPIRPRIYVTGYNGISIVDARTFQATDLLSGVVPRGTLSISADASILSCTPIPQPPAQEFRIDLNSLSALPTLPLPSNWSAVLEGVDNRAYVAARYGVYQIDASTGEMEQYFAANELPSAPVPTIAISPDRQILYVGRQSSDGDLSAYDVSTPAPTLLKKLSGFFYSLTPSRDGRFLYYVNYKPGGYSLVRANAPSLTSIRSVFTSSLDLGPTAEGPDGSIYQSILSDGSSAHPGGSLSVFDPITLRRTIDISLANFQTDNSYRYAINHLAFENSGKYFFAGVQGSRGDELWVFSTDLASFPTPVHPTKNLLNISTRGRVEAGENAMIGGFIVQGSKPKKVVIRGIGPSLPITEALANPILEVYDSSARRLSSNDNWTSNRINIVGTLLAPSSPRESALLMTLPPGAYTAILRDLKNQPGLGLVEFYDIDPKNSRLANISTRGQVGTGDNVLIGGFIIGGVDPTKVIIRAIGPSLANSGIGFPLADPILELHDGIGRLIARNDDWRTTQSSQIIATGIPPSNTRESALLRTLEPGNYTAIVRGKGGATGVALVEVYNLDSSTPPAN